MEVSSRCPSSLPRCNPCWCWMESVQVDAYLTCCLRESSQCLCRLSTVCCSHWTVETKNVQPLETMSRPFDVHVRDLDMGHFNFVLGGQKLVRLQSACVCICIKQLFNYTHILYWFCSHFYPHRQSWSTCLRWKAIPVDHGRQQRLVSAAESFRDHLRGVMIIPNHPKSGDTTSIKQHQATTYDINIWSGTDWNRFFDLTLGGHDIHPTAVGRLGKTHAQPEGPGPLLILPREKSDRVYGWEPSCNDTILPVINKIVYIYIYIHTHINIHHIYIYTVHIMINDKKNYKKILYYNLYYVVCQICHNYPQIHNWRRELRGVHLQVATRPSSQHWSPRCQGKGFQIGLHSGKSTSVVSLAWLEPLS